MAVDSTSYPYDTVVRITDIIGGVTYQGSGVLIAPDEVLTASHLLFISGIGTASDIVVTPGYNSGVAPYGSANGAFIHYFTNVEVNGLISNAASQSDYAVIHLSSPFAANGTMGLLANFSGGAVTVAGYPASASGALVTSSQTVARDPNYSLLDGLSLGPGSSGGPVFVGGASDPHVVGVVSSENGATGYDTLITSAVFRQIEQWVADDTGRAVTPAPDVSTLVGGTHTQYLIANDAGALYIQDMVAGRDGAQVKPGVDEVVYTDGVGRFDATGNAEAVARLYDTAFGRGADLTGLNDWTNQIDAGAVPLGNVAMAFIQSSEFQGRFGSLDNQGFVERLYQNALNRAGDAGGVAYWTQALNAGASRSSALAAISDSFEHKQDMLAIAGDKDMAEAYRLYRAAFGATPDAGGLAYWTGALDSGSSATSVAGAFAGSGAFASIFSGLDAAGAINQLYQNTFNRAADPAGVGYWVGRMQAGLPMGQVLLGFADSLENRVATAGATHDAWVYTTG